MQVLFPTAFFVQQAVLRRRAFWRQIVHINKNEEKIAFSRKKQNFSLPLPICFSHISFVSPPLYAIATTFPSFSFQRHYYHHICIVFLHPLHRRISIVFPPPPPQTPLPHFYCFPRQHKIDRLYKRSERPKQG